MIAPSPRYFCLLRGAARRASALLVCLILIVLMSILVVGFLTTAQMDMSASSQVAAGGDAARMAHIAVDTAMAKVRGATGDDQFWTSMPGKIVTLPTSDVTQEPLEVDLSSGDGTGLDDNESVNLNTASLTAPYRLLTGEPAGSGTGFRFRWVYLLKDNTHTTTVPSYDPANPVIGRYAYWTDDTSARINWNTAHLKSSSPQAAHPSRIDLTASDEITAASANAIDAYRRTNGFFNSPQSITATPGVPGFPAFPRSHRFSFTHYNSSPDLNPFNEPRLLLTTKASLAAASGSPYFDITTVEDADPGELANLNLAKVDTLYRKLYHSLTRTDWPLLPGVSFFHKYGDEGTKQLALSLIEYVRSAESAKAYIEPLRPVIAAGGSLSAINGGFTYMTSSRHPVITEMGVELSPTPSGSPSVFSGNLYVEVHLPAGASAPVNLAGLYLYHRDMTHAGNDYSSTDIAITTAMVVGGDAELPPGGYRVIVCPVAVRAPSFPATLFLRAAISRATPRVRLDIAPLGNTSYVSYAPDPNAVGMGSIPSVAVQDPFINKSPHDWVQGSNTFGSAPATAAPDPNVAPQQDTTTVNGGAIDPWSVQKAAPGPNHAIASVGELGRIHSGSRGANLAGIPWRTLRLQPQRNASTTLPDWALCELFATPLSPASPILTPDDEVVGGRINLNARVHPFSDPAGLALTLRPLPLIALLKGSPLSGGAITTSEAEGLAENIVRQTRVPTYGHRYGDPLYATLGVYLMPGELAEISGIADGGESSEETFADLIGLITTRSNSFMVYAIGQSIRQSSSGNLNVMAEHRVSTLFERTAQGEIRIRFQQQLQE